MRGKKENTDVPRSVSLNYDSYINCKIVDTFTENRGKTTEQSPSMHVPECIHSAWQSINEN